MSTGGNPNPLDDIPTYYSEQQVLKAIGKSQINVPFSVNKEARNQLRLEIKKKLKITEPAKPQADGGGEDGGDE